MTRLHQDGWVESESYPNGECPARVLNDLTGRAEINAHVILFANEKGGVGKTTLAFHTSVHLANRGYRVLAIDLDHRQRSLARAIENRHGTAVCLGVNLPVPRCCVLDKPSGSMLVQEIARLGAQCDVVVIDAPGHDAPVVRRAMALAHTLVTPVNASFFDFDVLGRFDPVSGELREAGPFARTLIDLRAEQAKRGQKPADWIISRNRVRSREKAQLERADEQLGKIADAFGIRVADGLRERVAYRSLLQFGITAQDIPALPQMASSSLRDFREIETLVKQFDLPPPPAAHPAPARTERGAPVPSRTRKRFAQSLQNTLAPQSKVALAS